MQTCAYAHKDAIADGVVVANQRCVATTTPQLPLRELRSLTALRTRIARKVRGRAVAMRRARQIARFRRNGFFADCMRRRVQVRFDANLRLVLLPAPRFPTHKAVPRPELERRIRARFDDEHT